MKRMLLLIWFVTGYVHADTIDHYMNIASNIPQMEIKADPQSQAWARSARNILALTTESIYESLALANESATKLGNPIYCLPQGTTLNSTMLNDLIQQTYRDMTTPPQEKDKLTVSQVALIGIAKQYPCKQPMQQMVATANPFKP